MISVRYIYNLFPSCHLILMFIYAVALYVHTTKKNILRLEIRKVTQVIGFNVMQKIFFVRNEGRLWSIADIMLKACIYNLCTFGEH